ncbi:helix-turn-helix DNA binding domain protein [Gordonia phage Evaa]|nr:helix-turn-helix DNA binding domain protein [Gordonia phage Evaa]
MNTQNPETYTSGLGELVRAYRQYLGITQLGMALKLGMAKRSYQRIETGQDDCPPGLIDSIETIVTAFETEVEQIIESTGSGMDIEVAVSADPRQEWHRAVVGRAATNNPHITPILVGEQGGDHGTDSH